MRAIMGIFAERHGLDQFEGRELTARARMDRPARRRLLPRRARHLCQPERGGELDAAPGVKRRRPVASRRSTGCSRTSRSACKQPGHKALRRRAADAGDCPHPAHRRRTAAAGRADRGTCAGHRAADRQHDPHAPRKGFTILLVEQNFRFAATVADRHYIVEHGRVIDMIPNAALEANRKKLQSYLGV